MANAVEPEPTVVDAAAKFAQVERWVVRAFGGILIYLFHDANTQLESLNSKMGSITTDLAVMRSEVGQTPSMVELIVKKNAPWTKERPEWEKWRKEVDLAIAHLKANQN